MQTVKDANVDIDVVVVVGQSSGKSERSQHARTTVTKMQFVRRNVIHPCTSDSFCVMSGQVV